MLNRRHARPSGAVQWENDAASTVAAGSAEVGPRPILAVLPFANLSADVDEYFSDGLTEDIIRLLARNRWLDVLSRHSGMAFRDRDASLREIAREAGVSPSTVRDVRQRLERGDDPLPQRLERGDDPLPQIRRRPEKAADHEAVSGMLQGLQSDPSLRFTEAGRAVLRWVHLRAIRGEEWDGVGGKVPPHCAYILAKVARSCADEWLQIAEDLEERGAQSA